MSDCVEGEIDDAEAVDASDCAVRVATFNPKKYWRHLDSFDLTREQKDELIHIVRLYLENFVDSAFGTHPVQQIGERVLRKIADSDVDFVECGDQPEVETQENGADDSAPRMKPL